MDLNLDYYLEKYAVVIMGAGALYPRLCGLSQMIPNHYHFLLELQ